MPTVLAVRIREVIILSRQPPTHVQSRTYTGTSRRQEMTNTEKGMIIAFSAIGMPIADISRAVGRPWSTVKNCINRYLERKTVDNAPRSGRPRVMKEEDEDTVIELIRNDRTASNEMV